MKHVWDIDYVQKKEISRMSVFELREYAERLEEELTAKDETIQMIIDGNRRKHGEWKGQPQRRNLVIRVIANMSDETFDRLERGEAEC